MRGNVFIGWSVSNEIAKLVKDRLHTQGYNGIVGGKDGNAVEHSVGATIISQMRKCSSAIMLFSVRELESGQKVLSSNMLFELGYLMGSLKLKRVLIVYVDGAEQLAPSDLSGAWSLTANTENKDKTVIAEEIVDMFMREQVQVLTQNKMKMTTDISSLRSILTNHLVNPVYYNDEIAQLCLMFCQAGYMHNDMKNTIRVLEDLLHSGIDDELCLIAINTSLDYAKVCEAIEQDETGEMHLRQKIYVRYERIFANNIFICNDIPDDNPFKPMILMILYDYMTFLDLMYYTGEEAFDIPDEVWETREKYALLAIKYSDDFIALDPDNNKEFAYLYQSYTYRNLAIFYKRTGKDDLAFDMFEKSRRVRQTLLQFFTYNDLNKNIFEQMSMEYYLALTDNIEDVDGVTKMTRLREIGNYLDEIEEATYNRNFLNRKIRDIYDRVKII